MSDEWVWYGGAASVDFVNTRRRRHADPVEYLMTPDDLARWLVAAGLCDDPGPIDVALLAAARDLREAIDASLTTRPHHAPTAMINSWLAAPRLELHDGVLVLAESGDARHALQRLALDAAHLLTGPDKDRIRICPGPKCGGRFLDRSAGRRRWCSMAVCGNRAKAAKHRAGRPD
jgi:predicted RNA-binding Zn ribbon-like protein